MAERGTPSRRKDSRRSEYAFDPRTTTTNTTSYIEPRMGAYIEQQPLPTPRLRPSYDAEPPRMRSGPNERELSSSSSSSSSYLDISRTFPNSAGNRILTFFKAPSERRRVRRRRSRKGLFKFGNNSSSSIVNEDLAYGTGFIKVPKSRVRRRDGKERVEPARSYGSDREGKSGRRGSRSSLNKTYTSDREGRSDREGGRTSRSKGKLSSAATNAEILALGAGLAKIAKHQNKVDLRAGGSRNVGRPELIAVKESSRRGQETSRGLGPSKISHGSDTHDDDDWESASDGESDFSVDSRLAYGDNGKSGGWSFFGRRKQKPLSRKNTIVDPQMFGPQNTLNGLLTQPVGFGEVSPWSSITNFGQPSRFEPTPAAPSGPSGSYSGSQAPLRQVFPMPTDDPKIFEPGRGSVISEPRYDPSRNSSGRDSTTVVPSRPDPIPIQQPQPFTPVSQSVYDPTYRTSKDEPSNSKNAPSSSGRTKSLAEKALAGVAIGAVGAAIVSSRDDRKDRKRDDEREEKDRSSRREKEREERRRDEEREEKDRLLRHEKEREERRRADELAELEKERLKRRESEKKASKDDRRRDKRSEDEDRKEKRRDKDRKKDDTDDGRREKKREKRRDETREEKEERKEKRRSERSDRSDVSRPEAKTDFSRDRPEPRRTMSEASVSEVAINPFQFQVNNDAFPTPTTEDPLGYRSRSKEVAAPVYVTVEREPDFSRMRSSSIKDQPSSSKPESWRDYDDFDDHDRRDRGRDRAYHEGEEVYNEIRKSTAPYDIAVTGAADAAVHAADARMSRSEKRRDERRRSERDYEYDSRDQRAAKERDPIQEEADRAYREIVMARKIASQVIRSRSASPDRSVVDKYGKKDKQEIVPIVTPPGMDDHKKKGPYDAPNADFRLDYVLEHPKDLRNFNIPAIDLDYHSSPDSPTKRDPDADRPRPFLNLVRPTPAPSPVPEKQQERSRSFNNNDRDQRQRRPSVDDISIGPKGNVVPSPSSSPISTTSKGVTWGENETKHYEIESPGEHRDEFVSKPEVKSRDVAAEPESKSFPKSKSKGWGAIAAGIIGVGAGAAAANSSVKREKNKEIENAPEIPFEHRGVVVEPEIESQKPQRRQSPPSNTRPGEEPASPLLRPRRDSPPSAGPKPTRSSHVPGAFEDDLDFTAHVAAGLKDTGFDPDIVINDPAFRRRDSPPGSNDRVSYQTPFAETVTDLGSIPADPRSGGFVLGEVDETPHEWGCVSPVAEPERTPTKLSKKEQKKRDKERRQSSDVVLAEPSSSRDVIEEPERYFEPTVSKKEQKKREREKKSTNAIEDITTAAELPPAAAVVEGIVEEPESYLVETPQKSKKKSKRSSTYDDAPEESPRDSRTVTVPVNAFDDIQTGEDAWVDSKKPKKKSKRDSERFDSPIRSAPTSEVGSSELERSSSKKSKDKSKRRSEQYEPEPTEVSLPPSTPSEYSRDGEFEESRKSRKSRDGDILGSADRGESRYAVSRDASRYDDDAPKKRKKSRSVKDDFDDTRSVASAPAGDDFDEKKSKKKDKEKDKGGRSSGIWGLFSGSKSESGVRDDSPKRSKDDFDDIKKKKKSKRSSVPDGGSIYGDIGSLSTADLSRALSNGNGNGTSRHHHEDRYEDGTRSDGERSERKKKSRSRSESVSSSKKDKDSFLDNAGTLGAGVGIAGAAAVAIAQHRSQSKAATARRSDVAAPALQKFDVFDYEITERQFRPSIDPQYGDLLPLPPSDPATPEIEPLESLPKLPDSRPDTPEDERIAKDRSMSAVRKNLQDTPVKPPSIKPPSQSTVPLALRFASANRSSPSSPGIVRSPPAQSPATPNPDSLSFPRPRSRPTSWEGTNEYRPLYLVETNRSRGSLQHEEQHEDLPALPESSRTSRSSSQIDGERGDELDMEAKPREFDPLSIDTALASAASMELLGSEQSTPRAGTHNIDGVIGDDALSRSSSPVGDPKSHAIRDAGLAAAATVAGTSVSDYLTSGRSEAEQTDSPCDELPVIARQPSPIDPVTKDRSSYLLKSSPMSKKQDDSPTERDLESPTIKEKEPDILHIIEEHGGNDSFIPEDIKAEREKALEILSGPASSEDTKADLVVESEHAPEFVVKKSKKDKKKDKKSKPSSLHSFLDDGPEVSKDMEPEISVRSAGREPEAVEEFMAKQSKKDKNKGKSSTNSTQDDVQVSEMASEDVGEDISMPTVAKPNEEFSLPKSKKDKKRDRKKAKSLPSWDAEADDNENIQSATEPDSLSELPAWAAIQEAEEAFSKPRDDAAETLTEDIEHSDEFPMSHSKKDRKKDKKNRVATAWDENEAPAVSSFDPEQSTPEVARDLPEETSKPSEEDKEDDFSTSKSKKDKKKDKKRSKPPSSWEPDETTAFVLPLSRGIVDDIPAPSETTSEDYTQISSAKSRKEKRKKRKSVTFSEPGDDDQFSDMPKEPWFESGREFAMEPVSILKEPTYWNDKESFASPELRADVIESPRIDESFEASSGEKEISLGEPALSDDEFVDAEENAQAIPIPQIPETTTVASLPDLEPAQHLSERNLTTGPNLDDQSASAPLSMFKALEIPLPESGATSATEESVKDDGEGNDFDKTVSKKDQEKKNKPLTAWEDPEEDKSIRPTEQAREAAEGLIMPPSKKGKKKGKKSQSSNLNDQTPENQIEVTNESVRRDHSEPPIETTDEPASRDISELSVEDKPIEDDSPEFTFPGSRKSKKKGKKSQAVSVDDQATETPIEITNEAASRNLSEAQAEDQLVEDEAPEFSVKGSKKSKKKGKKAQSSTLDDSTAEPAATESESATSNRDIPEVPVESIDEPAENELQFVMPGSRKEKKKGKKSQFFSHDESSDPQVEYTDAPTSRDVFQSTTEVPMEDKIFDDEPQEIVLPESKKGKKGRKAPAVSLNDFSEHQTDVEGAPASQDAFEPTIDTRAENKAAEDEPQDFVMPGSRKGKKKGKKSAALDTEVTPPVETKSTEAEVAVADQLDVSEEVVPAENYAIESTNKGYLSGALIGAAAAGAALFGYKSAKNDESELKTASAIEESETTKPSGDTESKDVTIEPESTANLPTPDLSKEGNVTVPDGLTAGYKDDQLSLARQLQEEFNRKPSKKDKKSKRQSLPSTPDRQPSRSRAPEDVAESSTRARSLSIGPSSTRAAISPGSGERKSVYSVEQLELARQLKEEFGSASKKSSKKDKKSRSSRSRARDESPFDEAVESPQPLPAEIVQEVPTYKGPEPTTARDGFEAGYQEDQLSLARQLQAEFSKKSGKKDKKTRNKSRTPQDLEPLDDYFGDASQAMVAEPLPIDEPSATAEPMPSPEGTRDGLAAGYGEDQLELARQLKEEFGPGSKKGKKDTKRQSLLRSTIDDDISSDQYARDADESNLQTPQLEADETALKYIQVPVPEDEFSTVTKKSKKDKKAKKREPSLRSNNEDDFSSDAQIRDAADFQVSELADDLAIPSESLAEVDDSFAPVTKNSKKNKKGKKRESVLKESADDDLPSDIATKDANTTPTLDDETRIDPQSTVEDEEVSTPGKKSKKDKKKRQSLLAQEKTLVASGPEEPSASDFTSTEPTIGSVTQSIDESEFTTKKPKKDKKQRQNLLRSSTFDEVDQTIPQIEGTADETSRNLTLEEPGATKSIVPVKPDDAFGTPSTPSKKDEERESLFVAYKDIIPSFSTEPTLVSRTTLDPEVQDQLPEPSFPQQSTSRDVDSVSKGQILEEPYLQESSSRDVEQPKHDQTTDVSLEQSEESVSAKKSKQDRQKRKSPAKHDLEEPSTHSTPLDPISELKEADIDQTPKDESLSLRTEPETAVPQEPSDFKDDDWSLPEKKSKEGGKKKNLDSSKADLSESSVIPPPVESQHATKEVETDLPRSEPIVEPTPELSVQPEMIPLPSASGTEASEGLADEWGSFAISKSKKDKKKKRDSLKATPSEPTDISTSQKALEESLKSPEEAPLSMEVRGERGDLKEPTEPSANEISPLIATGLGVGAGAAIAAAMASATTSVPETVQEHDNWSAPTKKSKKDKKKQKSGTSTPFEESLVTQPKVSLTPTKLPRELDVAAASDESSKTQSVVPLEPIEPAEGVDVPAVKTKDVFEEPEQQWALPGKKSKKDQKIRKSSAPTTFDQILSSEPADISFAQAEQPKDESLNESGPTPIEVSTEPADEWALPSKKSKKDKKKQKSGATTPFEELPVSESVQSTETAERAVSETPIEAIADVPVVEDDEWALPGKKSKKGKVQQKSGTTIASKELSTSEPAQATETTERDVPDASVEAITGVSEAKNEEWVLPGKKSKKDKKKQKSGESTLAEEVTVPVAEPVVTISGEMSEPTITEEAAKDAVSEPQEDVWSMPGKKSKKDKKKRKSGVSIPAGEVLEPHNRSSGEAAIPVFEGSETPSAIELKRELVVELTQNVPLAPLVETLPQSVTDQELSAPLLHDTLTSTSKEIVGEPVEDNWGAFVANKSKKDIKRKSEISTPIEEPLATVTPAVEETQRGTRFITESQHHSPEMSIEETAVETQRSRETEAELREAVEHAFQEPTKEDAKLKDVEPIDELFAVNRKKSKKDKKRKSGISTPMEESATAEAPVPEDRIRKIEPITDVETGSSVGPIENAAIGVRQSQHTEAGLRDAVEHAFQGPGKEEIQPKDSDPLDELFTVTRNKSKKGKKGKRVGSESGPATARPTEASTQSEKDVDLHVVPTEAIESLRLATSPIPLAEEPSRPGEPTAAPDIRLADPIEHHDETDHSTGNLFRSSSRNEKRKRQLTQPVDEHESIPAPLTTWADEVEEAEVVRETPVIQDITRNESLSHIPLTRESSPIDDFIRPTKKGKKGKKKSSAESTSTTDSFRDNSRSESVDKPSVILGIAAAGAAVTGGAASVSKVVEPSEEPSRPTPARKLSKKQQRKQGIDKRTPTNDIFDDDALWEGEKPRAYEGDNQGDNDDGFWSPPKEGEPISSRDTIDVKPLTPAPEIIEPATEHRDDSSRLDDAHFTESARQTVTPGSSRSPEPSQSRDVSHEIAHQPHTPVHSRTAESYVYDETSEKSPLVLDPPPIELSSQPSIDRSVSPEDRRAEHSKSPFRSSRFSQIGFSDLPVVEEEESHGADHHPTPHMHEDVNRDSAFVGGSPIPAQGGFGESHEHVRDSGVHLREPSPPRTLARPVSSSDAVIARLSWPPVDENTETVDLHRSQRRRVEPTASAHREQSRLHHLHDSPTLGRSDKATDFYRSQSTSGHSEHSGDLKDRDFLPSPNPKEEEHSDLRRTPTIHAGKESIVKQRLRQFQSHSQEEFPVKQRIERTPSPGLSRTKPKEDKYSELASSKPRAQTPKSFGDLETGAAVAGAALGFSAARKLSAEQRPSSAASQSPLSNINRLRTPDIKRPESGASNRSGTPPLRRTDRQRSGDLRSLSQQSKPDLAKEAELAAATISTPTPAPTNPQANEGRVRAKDMADVYDGFGEGRMGSPRSPTRPHSMRRRQSMQVLDLESRVEQLVAENRSLAEQKAQAEHAAHLGTQSSTALVDKDAEIDSLKRTLDWLQNEVSRLTEVNEGLTSANLTIARQHSDRYGVLEQEHGQATRELAEVRDAHTNLSAGMDGIVRNEVQNAVADKDREIAELRAELDVAKEQIREMQRQILASKANDVEFLTIRDEDYFDNACQQLCQHVQQWVLRFSKFSDMRACRLTSEINNDKTIDRLDNAILDGSDVDNYLGDRVKRRDAFMSMTMTMVWEFIFTRYLFGMDREQRQKLKSLEKTLSEVGPASAVHSWRATTLTLLAKREAFAQQREQDTQAVVHAIIETLSEILPPPSHLEGQIEEQLTRVMKSAVDLSIEMRCQRAEYMMLPPLQPEYDANGDLASKVIFNSALMNERSGDTVSNEDLEDQKAIVRIVLFPLVVKKGDDSGEGEEEIVVCPAQVLVAKPKKSVRIEQDNRSRVSMASAFPMEGDNVI